MGFDQVNVSGRARKGKKIAPSGVGIAVYQSKKRKAGTLTFFIGKEVLAAMGIDGPTRMYVAEGNGPDHGLFRLQVAPAGDRTAYAVSYTDGRDRGGVMPRVSVSLVSLRTLRKFAEIRPCEPATFQRFGSSLVVAVPWRHEPVEDSDLLSESKS